jgi:uncharacterized protein YodC (DUF2158 family)
MPPPNIPLPPDALRPGQLVKLVSGGPLMTVLSDGHIGSERKVACSWFDGGTHYHETKLPRAAVAPAPGDDLAAKIAERVFRQATEATTFEAVLAVLLKAARAGDLEGILQILETREAAK